MCTIRRVLTHGEEREYGRATFKADSLIRLLQVSSSCPLCRKGESLKHKSLFELGD